MFIICVCIAGKPLFFFNLILNTCLVALNLNFRANIIFSVTYNFVYFCQGTYARSHGEGSLFVATKIDTERLDIIQSLKDIIEFVTQSAIEIASKLRDQIKGLYEDIVNVINNIKQQAENAINEVESKIHEVLQNIGHGVNCVDQAAEEVESIISEARSGAQKCREAASKEVESLYTDLKQYSDSIQKEAGKIGDVISECITENNALEAATCTISSVSIDFGVLKCVLLSYYSKYFSYCS